MDVRELTSKCILDLHSQPSLPFALLYGTFWLTDMQGRSRPTLQCHSDREEYLQIWRAQDVDIILTVKEGMGRNRGTISPKQ